MKLKSFFILLVLVFTSVLLSQDRLPPGLSYSEDGKPLISPIDAPFVLKINIDGYTLQKAKLKAGGKGVYFMFMGENIPNLSLWVETPGHCEDLEKCKDLVAAELRKIKDLKSYQKKNFYVFEYVQDLTIIKMAHLRIQAFVSGYWIDIHASTVDSKIEDLLKVIDALEFSEKTF